MNTYMNLILEQRFFRLLSEYSQRKVSASEFTEAIEGGCVKTKMSPPKSYRL